MKRLSVLLTVVFIKCLLTMPNAFAVPELISYQGLLNDDSGSPVNASVAVIFSLYDVDTGGVAFWSENQNIEVINGVFNVTLGSSTELDPAIFELDNLYLGIKVDSDTEMTPRQQITSSSYSMRAGESLSQLTCANKEVARFDEASDSWLCYPQQWEVVSYGPFNLDISLTGEYDWYRLTVNATGFYNGFHGQLRLKFNGGGSYTTTTRDSLGNIGSFNGPGIYLLRDSGYSGSILIPNDTNNAYFSFNQTVLNPRDSQTYVYQQANFSWTELSRIELTTERDVRGSYVLEGLKLPPP